MFIPIPICLLIPKPIYRYLVSVSVWIPARYRLNPTTYGTCLWIRFEWHSVVPLPWLFIHQFCITTFPGALMIVWLPSSVLEAELCWIAYCHCWAPIPFWLLSCLHCQSVPSYVCGLPSHTPGCLPTRMVVRTSRKKRFSRLTPLSLNSRIFCYLEQMLTWQSSLMLEKLSPAW